VASRFFQRLSTAFDGDKRGPECQKSSFLRLKMKKEGEPAFSYFIRFYFLYRMFGIYGFYPSTGGRIIHPSAPCNSLQAAAAAAFCREAQPASSSSSSSSM
jgi:hypothetical protein